MTQELAIEVAIVGGGPAGSVCAHSLAEQGVYPTIFDESHPREKPCGGLISPGTQRRFPFLQTLPIGHAARNRLCIVSPSGRRTYLYSTKIKIRCFSRAKLDMFLLDRALSGGAELVKERVTAVARQSGLWKIKTRRGFHMAKVLVGADGVNSLVRKALIGPLNNRDKGVCCGYIVKGLENEDFTLALLPHREGYLWITPRDDHTCVGIGSAEPSRCKGLRKELDLFMKQHFPQTHHVSKWAALIPIVKDRDLFTLPVAGSGWTLIGDAAGHVDPIWGEGMIYAMTDGELAADAIKDGNCSRFDRLWKEAYGKELSLQVKLRKWIHTRPILELYCKLLKLRTALPI